MGLFGNVFASKKVVGTFDINHYANGDIILKSDFSHSFKHVAFAFYLDQIVYNSGVLGERLYISIKRLAEEAFTDVVQKETDIPLEKRLYEPVSPLAGRVVAESSSQVQLHVKAELLKKGDGYSVSASFSPLTCPDTEGVVRMGCEAMFMHLFNTGDKETKFYMPIVLLKQCEWYETNGVPSVTELTAAAWSGLQAMEAIASRG